MRWSTKCVMAVINKSHQLRQLITWRQEVIRCLALFLVLPVFVLSDGRVHALDVQFDFGFDNTASDAPFMLEVGANGDIYATTGHSAVVEIFDSNGVFKSSFGGFGNESGKFNSVLGIAVNSVGNLVIADEGNHRIQVFDSLGNFQFTFGTHGTGNGQFYAPLGVAVDASDNIYITDRKNSRVQVFDSSGNYLYKFGTSGSGNGQFSNHYGIEVDGEGNILVADSGNSRLQVFDDAGTFQFSFGTLGSGDGELTGPVDIGLDSSGNIFVTEHPSNNRVSVFDHSGTFLMNFGSLGGGEGEFDHPLGIAMDNDRNRFIISDRKPLPIQVFSIVPSTEPSVFLSDVSDVGGGVDPSVVPELNLPVGSNGSLWVWVTDEQPVDTTFALDIVSDTPGVIDFTGAEVLNADVTVDGLVVDTRWQGTGNGSVQPDGQSVQNFVGVSVTEGTGLDPSNNGVGGGLLDAGYDVAAGAFLFARVDFDVIGEGVTDLSFGEGRTLIVHAGVDVADQLDLGTNKAVVSFILGDVNRDGGVDGLDVGPFIQELIISSSDPFADMDGNGAVNGLDVGQFVDAVIAGGVTAVPEPDSVLLALVGIFLSCAYRKRCQPV